MKDNRFKHFEPTGEYRNPRVNEYYVADTSLSNLSRVDYITGCDKYFSVMCGDGEISSPRIILRKVTHQHIYKCDCGDKCHE